MEPSVLTELSIQTLRLLSKSLIFLSDLSAHPLFAVAATSSLLALLYLPRPLLPLIFSPALLSSLLLISTLLRFRPPASPPSAVSPPRPIPQTPAVDEPIALPTVPNPKPESAPDFAGFRQKAAFCDSFVEWGRRGGPLEVIYEEYEGEEDEDGGDSPGYLRSPEYSYPGGGELCSLGFCFTDSSEADSDDDSSAAEGWESPENLFSRWDEEGDGMIEIALEEDNMIEIDISDCR
ncbi:uncharacterized protein LOC103719353 [Phoenix dactylifera]|uniref:Uncharacterized protein LOC103719353 n=1 Tax=Phoenix dactylifera TaxID=42345 RepID=A0A8B9A7L2_PHODC|nr:uncharacterized protein LOC103719353 [Phoenix dactylifera]XP_038981692.1 uncharacterized protein LOC103719353 [Phoenix dactylifera]